MPIYEYRCTVSGKIFEFQQRMSDPPKTICKECGGGLERILSSTSFQLKGGGWYKDLYSSVKPEKAQSASEGTSSSKESGSKESGSKESGSKESGSKESASSSSSQSSKSSTDSSSSSKAKASGS